jgi:hypothetical protein
MKKRSEKLSTSSSRHVLPLNQRDASQTGAAKQKAPHKSGGALPVEMYSDEQIAEFDRIDEELKRHLQGK